MRVLAVTNWNAQFENNRTREMKRMAWVPVPNKHDGLGFTELIDHDEGMAHLGAWLIVLQIASKCPQRGLLIDDRNRPIDCRMMARVSRGEKAVFESAIPRLVDIGWLSYIEIDEKSEASEITGFTSGCDEAAGKLRDNAEEQNRTEGTERNAAAGKNALDDLLKDLRSKIRSRWQVERWVANSLLDRLLRFGAGWPKQFTDCQNKQGQVTREWIDASVADGSIEFHLKPRSLEQLKRLLDQ